MNKSTIIILMAIVILGIVGGVVYLGMDRAGIEEKKMVEADNIIENVQNSNDTGSTSYGALLAGANSSYYIFTQSAYEEALASDKIVFLEFYADWCPICRAEQPEIINGFNQLTQDNIIGFRANYKDDETDDSEEALAKQLEVTYQHTKFIFKNGQQVLRDGNPWQTDDFLEAIASFP